MEYKILKELTHCSLEKKVNMYLDQGYQPQGGVSGVFLTSDTGITDTYYMQAIIKK